MADRRSGVAVLGFAVDRDRERERESAGLVTWVRWVDRERKRKRKRRAWLAVVARWRG